MELDLTINENVSVIFSGGIDAETEVRWLFDNELEQIIDDNSLDNEEENLLRTVPTNLIMKHLTFDIDEITVSDTNTENMIWFSIPVEIDEEEIQEEIDDLLS